MADQMWQKPWKFSPDPYTDTEVTFVYQSWHLTESRSNFPGQIGNAGTGTASLEGFSKVSFWVFDT